MEIDHINMIKLLREATRGQNTKNRGVQSNNYSKLKGVHYKPRLVSRPWSADIQINGKMKHLWYFPCPMQAHAAYCNAARIIHEEFFRAEADAK